MSISRQSLATLLVVAVHFTTHAAEPVHYQLGHPIFHSVAGAEEIPENVASSIEQDRSGFLWIGTPDGLVRYDGYVFRTFRHDPHDARSLAENHVRAIRGARDGRVWVGASDGGISIFDPATETFRRLTEHANELSSDNIRDLVEGEGGMWVATTAGLDFVDQRTLKVSHIDVTPADAKNRDRTRLGALLIDGQGDLWIGTADGLTVRRKSGAIETAGTRAGSGDSLAGKPVYRLFQAMDGTIWLGFFGGGLARFDPRSGVATIVDPELRGYSFAQMERDRFWVGTTGDGIEERDAKDGHVVRRFLHDPSIPESIPSNRTNGLFVDRSGIAWIGTTGRGLARYNPADAVFQLLRFSPNDDSGLTSAEIESVFESSDGLLWVGTHDNGVDVFDGTTRVTGYRAGKEKGRSLDSPNIGAIAETADGSIWLGGFGSLNRLDRRSGAIEGFASLPFGKTAGRITTLLPSADGKGLWVGTNAGLAHFDIATRVWSLPELENGKNLNVTITDIELDPKENVWVTSLTGIAVLPRGETRFRALTNKKNTGGTLPAGSTLDLLFDRKKQLWIGMSNGLLRLTSFDGREARFESIAPRLGLENRRCDNLLEDARGQIWIEDNAVFDPERFQLRSFAADEGAGRSIWRGAAIRTRSGQFVLGGPDGLFFIDPAALRNWDFAPPVVLTSLRIDGVAHPTSELKEILLAPDTKNVAMEFAALDFSAPARNRYSYRLRGFDKDWTNVDAGHRTATYTSLPPGNYVFEIRGSNREGAWSRSIVSLPVRAQPAFYQTTVFRIATGLFLIGLTWPLYRMRLRMLEARHHELEGIVAARTAEAKESEQRALEASQAKTIFLTNMSHELRTPLNATLGFARLVQRSPNLSADDRDNLVIVERSGEHLLSLINQVLSISKIEAGKMTLDLAAFDLHAMLGTIERMFRSRAEQERIQFTATVSEDVPRHVKSDEGKLRQAIINLLGNAVKFTPAGGRVTFTARAGGDRVVFEVADTGPGIADDELRLLFQPFVQTESGRRAREGTGLGLAITKRIAELLGGAITAESRLGEGSTFRFAVPLEVASSSVARAAAPRVTRLASGQTPPRVLVVDDTAENRILLLRLLALAGCDTRGAENGRVALEEWRRWKPDLVFMDMRMPVMDGREAIRTIRGEESAKDRSRVIALTASVYVEERETLIADGFDEVIFKPYTEEEIFAALADGLGVRFEYEQVASVAASVREPRVHGGRRVLIADDDFANRAITGEMLRIAECEVIEATNGEEALERLESAGPFDVVLVDVEMPRMGGIEVVRRIRADVRYRDLAVIAMTAHTDSEVFAELKAAGMDDALSKPIESDELAATLDRCVLARRRPGFPMA